MIVYSKLFVKVAEFYYDQPAAAAPVDIVRYRCRLEKPDAPGVSTSYSIVIDLSTEPEQLLAEMSRSTRTQIHKASREQLRFCFFNQPDADCISEFRAFHARFAQTKNLPAANGARLNGLRAANALTLSSIGTPDGATLAWHAWVRTSEWARLLYSASLFRTGDKEAASQISRANRYAHWMEMLRFREEGLRWYDFGGWHEGSTDAEKLRINFFKEGFGGKRVALFDLQKAVSLRGALALRMRRAAGTHE